MAIRRYTTGTVTMTGTTDTSILKEVTGRIKSIAIKPETSSKNFKVYCKKAGVNEYFLGGASATVTVATSGAIFSPTAVKCDATGTNISDDVNILEDFITVIQDVYIEVSDGAANETYVVEIIAEE